MILQAPETNPDHETILRPTALKTHRKMNQVESLQPQIKMQRISWKIASKLFATEDR